MTENLCICNVYILLYLYIPIKLNVFLVPHLYKYLFLFVLLGCQAGTLQAQHFSINSNKKKVSLHFQMVRDMMVVPLYINQKGPFNFILDSGVGLMILTDPTLIDSLNIDTLRTIKLYGSGNTVSFDAYRTAPLNVVFKGGGIAGNHISAAIFKKDHFGLSNYTGMPIHGLLGYEFFANMAVKLNFSDSTLIAAKPGIFKPFKKGVELPISIEENKPYLKTNIMMPDGCLAQHKFVVDLGATHPLSLEKQDQYKGYLQNAIVANLGLGLTGIITGRISRVTEIELGKYKFKNVITSFPDSNHNGFIIPRDGNLGLGILKKFSLVLDYQNGKMYLKSNYRFKEPFEHDMSGLEYYAGGKDLKHIFISRVEPGSAAEEAGIVANDEITAVNLKDATQMNIVELDKLFKSKDKRSILVEIYRNKAYATMIMTLKRRI